MLLKEQELNYLIELGDAEHQEEEFKLLSKVNLLEILFKLMQAEMYDKDQRIALLEEKVYNMEGEI